MLWGLMLPPGQPYSVTVEEEVQLSMIALESRGTYAGAGQAPVQITVHTGSAEYLLCTLVPGHLYQQVVDVKLSPKEKVVFCAHGSGLVHVTGYTKQCFQELFDAGYQEVEPHADDPVLEVIEEDHWQEMPTDIEPHQNVSPPPPKRSRLTPTRPTAKVTSLPQDENNMVIGSNRMTTLASIHDQSITSHSLSGTNTGQIDVNIKEESDSVEIVLPSSASNQTAPHFSESTLSFAALTPIRSTAISTPSTSTMPSIQHLVVPTEPSTSAGTSMQHFVSDDFAPLAQQRRQLYCKRCVMQFDTENELNNHRASSDHIGRHFVCRICEQGFHSNDNLIVHTKTHQTGLLHRCSVCQKTFTRRWNLQQHELLHKKYEKLDCKYCGTRFRYVLDCERHLHLCPQRPPYPNE